MGRGEARWILERNPLPDHAPKHPLRGHCPENTWGCTQWYM